jgi:hypothetical protein
MTLSYMNVPNRCPHGEYTHPLHGGMSCDKCEIERLRAERDECRRLLRFVIDHATRNAGSVDNPYTYIWQRDWDEFEAEAATAGGDDE